MTGRDRELARVLAALTGTGSGGTPFVEVTGDPGTGKSLLLTEACERLAARGTVVIRSDAARVTDAVLSVLPDRSRSGRRLLLVLDDLHRATPEALDALRRLRPAVLCAYRPRRTPPGLARLLRELPADRERVGVDLGPLDPADARRLTGLPVDGEDAAWCARAGGGVPRHVIWVARSPRLPSAARRRAGDGFTDLLPLPAHPVVDAELDALDGVLGRVARAAAVVGDPFAAEPTAAVAGVDAAAFLAAVDELVRRDLVRPDTEGCGLLRFRHPLVRARLYQRMPVADRLAAHRHAAALLAATGTPAARARHLSRCAPATDAEAAAALARAAARDLDRHPARAVVWAGEALRRLPARAARERGRTLVLLAEALGSDGRLREARTVLGTAAAAAADPGQRAAVARLSARYARLLGRHAEAADALGREPTGGGDPDSAVRDPLTRAGLRWEAAVGALAAGDTATARRSAMQSWDFPRLQAPDSRLRGAVLRAATEAFDHGPRAADHQLLGVVREFDALPDPALVPLLDAVILTAAARRAVGPTAEAARLADRAVGIARHTGQRGVLPDALLVKAAALLDLGALDAAVACCGDAVRLARDTGAAEHTGGALALLAECERHGSGNGPGAAYQQARRALEGRPASRLTVLARARLWSVSPAGRACGLVAIAGGEGLPGLDRCERPRWMRVLAEAELRGGDAEAARVWARRAAEAAADLGSPVQTAHALAAGAAVALARGGFPAAGVAARSAAAAFGRAGLALEEGAALLSLARALAGEWRWALVPPVLARVRAIAAECGSRRLHGLAVAEQRRVMSLAGRVREGARTFADPPGGGIEAAPATSAGEAAGALPPRGGPPVLTRRESQITGLVASGLPNSQVAARLGVNAKTVEAHLTRIYRKLGVTRRSSLVSLLTAGTPGGPES
ncbi:LuxR family transcriptional regulator [Streptantibioticus parmotrematis]|uniref:helix-turn-helix transcriptional regulator n=1 Tax=Streptantibioticus parmotrematis TaxID=2873249 RepID=UPI0034083B29